MTVKFNGREVHNPTMKVIIIVFAGIVVSVIATIIIPILGIVLGAVLLIVGILIPIFGWKKIIGKLTSRININYEQKGYTEIESDLFESMTINKVLKLVSNDGDIKIVGTDNYNKFSIRCNQMSYSEDYDEISVFLDSDAEVVVPRSMTIVIMTGLGNVDADDVWSLDVNSGSGDLKVSNLRYRVKAATGAGDFNISFLTNAKCGVVDLKTASGDAVVCLPEEASVKYKCTSLGGNLMSEFKLQEQADFDVQFTAVSGDLELKKII